MIEAAIKPSSSAQAQLKNIVTAVDAHIAGHEQFDDVTLLAVHRKKVD